MKHEITFGGALANCSGSASSDDLLNFLKERTEGVEYYQLSPPPGTHMNAAMDWQAVLGVTASTLGIAQALWAAYVKFIKPLRDKGDDSPFLFIAVKNAKNESIQYSIGADGHTEEEFIHEFSQKTEQIRIISEDEECLIERTEIRTSTYWKKI